MAMVKESHPKSNNHTSKVNITRVVKWALFLPVIWLMFTSAWIAIYGFVPVPVTPLMVIRSFDTSPSKANAPKNSQGEESGWKKKWVPLAKISPMLQRAVVIAEDQKFYQHYGFDLEAIEKAIEHNQKKPTRKKGASTISQQTAKNLFLWPHRSWLRKGLETYFTAMMELMWSKNRILEVYLNVIEFGPGVYGAEAASQTYFRKPAERLTSSEAALLAGCLPNPRKLRVNAPGPYLLQRQTQIVSLLEGRTKIRSAVGREGESQGAGDSGNLTQAGKDILSESNVDADSAEVGNSLNSIPDDVEDNNDADF